MALTKTTTEEELDDTATSPVKSRDVDMTGRELSDSGVKKRLLPSIEQNGENLIGDTGPAPMVMITDGDPSSAGIVASKRSSKTVKRTKKDGADSPSLGSADSRDGSVRSQ